MQYNSDMKTTTTKSIEKRVAMYAKKYGPHGLAEGELERFRAALVAAAGR